MDDRSVINMDPRIYAKAIAALLVPVIIGTVGYFGILPDMSVKEAITLLVTGAISAAGVYFVPNMKK